MLNQSRKSFRLAELAASLEQTRQFEGNRFAAAIIRRHDAASRLNDYALMSVGTLARLLESTVLPTQEDETALR
jgi:hypothetical protein